MDFDFSFQAAAKEIAMIKIVVPRTVGSVVDRSMQAFGAAGECIDVIMTSLCCPFVSHCNK